MADPARRLARARRDARRFAQDARRLARRHARLLGKARAVVDSAADEVLAAAAEGEPERLSGALKQLDALWDEHLARRVKPLWREYAESVVAAVVLALLLRAFAVDAFRIPSGSMVPTLLAGDAIFVSKLAYGVRIPFTHLRVLERAPPRRGDVIVFESPRDPASDFVKRIIGVPGDVIELREQVLYVNGIPQPRTPEGEYAYADREPGERRGAPETCRRFREALAKGDLATAAGGLPSDVEASWQAAAASGVATYEVVQCRRTRLAAREGPFEVVRPGHVFVLGDNRDLSADSRGAGGWQVPYGHIRGRAEIVFWSWGEGGLWPRGRDGVRLERLFKPIE